MAFEQYLREHGQNEIRQQGSKATPPTVKMLSS
jgi:hypothetical protein